ncbi:MAG: hypothetical protein DRR16_02300 [Candidatus Parabeggiatoa sp. nov. 3]|jgi:hypothetical protein|nr:MAG: hypothetical protein DRR00_14420 [Gammaproteobacteria bacterium]RKZ67027.1 MAG: hypothetical protein DRQ99_07910 [Gammaproteobacteria bacterium]RKZ89502.1 MAG: hypothetical protein DRR16_02300 [Gammaproteobacteria bacterium]
MSSAKKRLQEILEQEVENTKRRVFLVEGEDDVEAYNQLLNRQFLTWESKWAIFHAGNKQKVIDMLADEPTWLGLIDRDEWSDERILQEQNALSNLLVLPRFCLENYLICPDEIWEALSENQRAKIADGLPQLKAEILAEKEKWIRHGVLWTIINPLWEGIKVLGFKGALLDFNNAQDDTKIQDVLKRWHDFLEPQHIFTQFQNQLNDVLALEESEQLKKWVHGKPFYHLHVHQVLNRLLGQESAEMRKNKILQTCPLPNDLDFLYQMMGLV